jgi:hypothetical protein
MSTPLERAEEAMQEAQQELKDAKTAYTEDFKRKHPSASEVDLLEYLESKLKTLNDNLQRKEESYNLLLRQLPQQGIGMEANGRRKSKCWLGKSYCTVRRDF